MNSKTTQPAPALNDPKMVAALRAVDKILANLKTSDLVNEFGSRVFDAMKEYRIDMAADIAGEF